MKLRLYKFLDNPWVAFPLMVLLLIGFFWITSQLPDKTIVK